MKHLGSLLLGCAAVAVMAPFASAHFRLLEPQGWLVENNLGDPQKLGPCGGTSRDKGMLTGIVGKAQGGQKLHIKIQETVFHPGHYRVALAMNSQDELPADPQAATRDTDKGPWSVSAPIQSSPVAPVLADGLFPHTMRPPQGQTLAPWETDVTLPNITCAKCTLQVTQFMAEHGLNADGGYYYHHCAELQITADPSKPVDTRWTAKK